MTLDDLKLAFRSRTDDTIISSGGYLWSDAELTLFLNEAVTEACVRAKLIFDVTSPFCSFPVVIGQQAYPIDPSIFEIQSVRVDGYNGSAAPGYEMIGTDQTALSRDYGRWYALIGRPKYYMQDGFILRFVPLPDAVGTVQLAVYRTPTDTEAMSSGSDEPVIPNQFHLRLLDWALYLAYSKGDAEAGDDKKAAIAEARFETSFGKRTDADTQRKRQERRSHVVSVNWPASRRDYGRRHHRDYSTENGGEF